MYTSSGTDRGARAGRREEEEEESFGEHLFSNILKEALARSSGALCQDSYNWSCNKYVACLPNWPREGKVKQNCSIYPKLRQPCTNCKIGINPFARYIGNIVSFSFIDKKWIKGNEFAGKSLDGSKPKNNLLTIYVAQ